jgi:hypothetical protein
MVEPEATWPRTYVRKTQTDGAASPHHYAARGRVAEDDASLHSASDHGVAAEPKQTVAIRPMRGASTRAVGPLVEAQVKRIPPDDEVSELKRSMFTQSASARPQIPAPISLRRAATTARVAHPHDESAVATSGPSSITGEHYRSSSLRQSRAPIQPATASVSSRSAAYRDQKGPLGSRKEAATEPTIQVTIGRIEIRAEQPAAHRLAKEHPPSQPMSLDDYLRRRGGRSGE